MSNDSFQFKKFTVRHDRCAMKVGTDGVLLGAWAAGGSRILDVGTGSGLIALMMAQRFPEAQVDAVDIDEAACSQAEENVAGSPFSGRIRVVHASLQRYVQEQALQGQYDAIVSNPPFFTDALKNPDARRSLARHTDTLSFAELFWGVGQLLTGDGHFCVVVPADCRERMLSEGYIAGFRIHHELFVKTVERKPVKRVLLDFSRAPYPVRDIQEECMQANDGERSEWYASLTKDFYLK